jgi:hypothetical protein
MATAEFGSTFNTLAEYPRERESNMTTRSPYYSTCPMARQNPDHHTFSHIFNQVFSHVVLHTRRSVPEFQPP